MSLADSTAKEERALDALVSASLRCDDAEITADEVAEFLQAGFELSPADEAALQNRTVDEIISGERACEAAPNEFSRSDDSSKMFMAMNRKNTEDQHTEETQAELERKRQEILARLKAKKQEDIEEQR